MTGRRFTRAEVPAPFSATGECGDAACTVTIAGEVDLATSPAFTQELERHDHGDHRALRLDLSGVDFLDSSALNVLLHTRDRLVAEERELAIVPPAGAAMRAIEVTGLQRVLPLVSPG